MPRRPQSRRAEVSSVCSSPTRWPTQAWASIQTWWPYSTVTCSAMARRLPGAGGPVMMAGSVSLCSGDTAVVHRWLPFSEVVSGGGLGPRGTGAGGPWHPGPGGTTRGWVSPEAGAQRVGCQQPQGAGAAGVLAEAEQCGSVGELVVGEAVGVPGGGEGSLAPLGDARPDGRHGVSPGGVCR